MNFYLKKRASLRIMYYLRKRKIDILWQRMVPYYGLMTR